MGEAIMYTDLKRNRIGGINGTLGSGVESTLAKEECELAEAGEWGAIADYTQAEKDADAQAQKLIKAESDFNIAMSPVLQTANQLERDTWTVQEKEARDWLADNTDSVPFITTLAATRGIELSELVARIIAKADAYSNMLATALGEKHKAEDNA